MKAILRLAAAAALTLAAGSASAGPVSLTKLTGITGGTVAGTAVYKADLSSVGLGNILSLSIADNSSGLGGSTGEFTGFDLDAVILSTTDCADAACAKALSGLAVFDFVSGTFFTPGTQRPPLDAKLFGTDGSGNNLDPAVGTLDALDGESIAGPGADGFLSLGDNGLIKFNLLAPVSTAGLYLYIGEVGDNGEVAASNITVSDIPVDVPEPGTLALLGLAAAGLAAARRRAA